MSSQCVLPLIVLDLETASSSELRRETPVNSTWFGATRLFASQLISTLFYSSPFLLLISEPFTLVVYFVLVLSTVISRINTSSPNLLQRIAVPRTSRHPQSISLRLSQPSAHAGDHLVLLQKLESAQPPLPQSFELYFLQHRSKFPLPARSSPSS